MSILKRIAKRAMFSITPGLATRFFASRSRAHSHRFLESCGVVAINLKLRDRFGDHVLSGPFKGMQLAPGVWKEPAGPMILGTYEKVLHPWFERVIASQPTLVIDVGSKIGYYVAGLGRRIPAAEIIAFDADSWAMQATTEAARLNGVNISVRGLCNPAILARLARPGAFILCDCEGYESELFRNTTPYLKTTLLIETHEHAVAGVESQLLEAFRSTHQVERVVCDGRNSDSPVDLDWLDEDASEATNEHRGTQAWLFFTPKP
jgi:hypothetical protein